MQPPGTTTPAPKANPVPGAFHPARLVPALLLSLIWSIAAGPGAAVTRADEPAEAESSQTDTATEAQPDLEALDALRQSAADGPPEAKFELAALLLQIGGDEFEAEAVALLTEAAAGFHLDSIFMLGICHSDGLGVEANDQQAVAHYRRAADLGHDGAQLMLGIALQEGRGIDENPAEAIPWLQRSGNQGNAFAMLRLSEAYFEGLGVEANEAVGFEMAMRATRTEHPAALMYASQLWITGKGTEPDIGRAIRLLERAGDAPWAKNNLAWLLATGPDPEHHDGDRAARLAREALDELTVEFVWAVTDTLAASEARRGRFDQAVTAQQQAIEQYQQWREQQDEQTLEALAEELGESKLPELEHRLAIYQDRQAVREDPETGDSHPDDVRDTPARPRDRRHDRERPRPQQPAPDTPAETEPADEPAARPEMQPEAERPGADRDADTPDSDSDTAPSPSPDPGPVPDKLRNFPKGPPSDDEPAPGGRILI